MINKSLELFSCEFTDIVTVELEIIVSVVKKPRSKTLLVSVTVTIDYRLVK